MSDYLREILKPNLKDFGSAINDEEAGGSEFIRSSLIRFESRFTNLATFTELSPGQLPDREVQVLEFGSAPPAGTSLIWSGTIIVNGKNVTVSVFR